MRFNCLAALQCITLAFSFAAGAQGLTLIPNSGVYLTGVSADGSVAAGYDVVQYLYWTAATGPVVIGGIAPGSQGAGGSCEVSHDGTKLCGGFINPVTTKAQASVYSLVDQAWHPCGSMGASCDINSTSAWSISGDGNRVVGLGYPVACDARAFSWTLAGGFVNMGTTQLLKPTRANDCDLDGNVIVGWQDLYTGFRQGAVWINGVQTLMKTSTNILLSEAQACSDDGSIVVGLGASSFNYEGWRWTSATGPVSLGAPPITGHRIYPTDISADGTKILCFGRAGPPATSGEGYIWTQSDGFVSIEQIALLAGVTVPDGTFFSLPLGISADGLTIVGACRTSEGNAAFILDLHPAALPCNADIDGNGFVDGLDLTFVLSGWGWCDVTCPADINDDAIVDGLDLATVLSGWGTCP